MVTRRRSRTRNETNKLSEEPGRKTRFFCFWCRVSVSKQNRPAWPTCRAQITGGTECYGRRYFATIRITSIFQMSSDAFALLSMRPSLLEAKQRTVAADRPSDLLVEVERIKVLLRCRFLLYPCSPLILRAHDDAATPHDPTFVIT